MKVSVKHFLIIFIVVFIQIAIVQSATVTSTGNWNSTGSWSGGDIGDNGEFSETDVVAVDFKGNEDFEVELYPNPINQGHNLYLKVPTKEGEEFNVFVNDLLGKDYITDLTFINQGNSTLVILELSSTLPSGTYFINVVTSGGVTSKKVLVK